MRTSSSNIFHMSYARVTVVLGMLVVLAALTTLKSDLAIARHTCLPSAGESVRDVNPGDDLDAIVNGDPRTSATTFCIHAGTYLIDQVVVPRDGDALVGEPGTSTVIGPATKREPVVLVRDGGVGLSRFVQPTGSNIRLEWLDISGANVLYNSQTRDSCGHWGEVANKCPQAGTGVAIVSGKADGTLLITHVRVGETRASALAAPRERCSTPSSSTIPATPTGSDLRVRVLRV